MIKPVFACSCGALHPVQRGLSRRRDGFALMATLWIVVAIAAVTFSMAESAHLLMDSARNRTNARVAEWRAIGCFARIRANLANDSGPSNRVSAIWDSLDAYAAAQDDGCTDTAFADRTVIDVNHASARAINATLNAVGADPAAIGSVMAMTVAGGHRPYGSDEEMETIAGAAMRRAGADSLFGVDTGRVILGRASWPVRIGAMTDMFRDSSQNSVGVSMAPSNSPSSPSPSDESTSLANSPATWWLRIVAAHGDPPATVRLEAHVVLLGGSIGIEDVRLR